MDLGLAGRVYVVSGGSRGLGRAVADVLVAEGARVVLGARDQAATDAAGRRLLVVDRPGYGASTALPGRWWVERLPAATVHEVPGAGHLFPLTAWAQVLATVS